MATNLAINDELLSLAQKVGGLKTKKETVNTALKEFVQRRRQEVITELFGTVEYDSTYDYKKAQEAEMNVLVDTSVWSLALRKRPKTNEEEQVVSELSELIREMRVIMIGPIRQELLSGISDEGKFKTLKEKLRTFEDKELSTEHFELAAAFSNKCRQAGVQGSHTDFLICAFSALSNCDIFTLDKDFDLYTKHIKIRLHSRWKHL